MGIIYLFILYINFLHKSTFSSETYVDTLLALEYPAFFFTRPFFYPAPRTKIFEN